MAASAFGSQVQCLEHRSLVIASGNNLNLEGEK